MSTALGRKISICKGHFTQVLLETHFAILSEEVLLSFHWLQGKPRWLTWMCCGGLQWPYEITRVELVYFVSPGEWSWPETGHWSGGWSFCYLLSISFSEVHLRWLSISFEFWRRDILESRLGGTISHGAVTPPSTGHSPSCTLPGEKAWCQRMGKVFGDPTTMAYGPGVGWTLWNLPAIPLLPVTMRQCRLGR